MEKAEPRLQCISGEATHAANSGTAGHRKPLDLKDPKLANREVSGLTFNSSVNRGHFEANLNSRDIAKSSSRVFETRTFNSTSVHVESMKLAFGASSSSFSQVLVVMFEKGFYFIDRSRSSSSPPL